MFFFANISTWLPNYVPKFGLYGSFFTRNKMSQKDFEISNLGMKSESRLYGHCQIRKNFSTACSLLFGGLTVEKEKGVCPEAIFPLENLILN